MALLIYLFVEAPFSNLYSLFIGKKHWHIGLIKFQQNKINNVHLKKMTNINNDDINDDNYNRTNNIEMKSNEI